ncbi:sigma-70 family RNA polymerase sigma factor [Bacillus sp. FJAT-29790]|uniref:sigma-70 family RNA polymerase sigma factor n=1 Tax=Bacillus sp. FJAT-29790 TaxID=1895002 RepID=UPI001C2489F1|nr:sigma-70 family RNA polymerase sigma factor [Bacillus sp. FJAT-29790]MBU8881121.1 sigma-70 family RNA polymerase sigma factor [Bacillus sp. FJAT-29790]
MESFEQLAKQYEPMIHKVMRTLHIYKNQEEFFQLGLIALWDAKKRFNQEKGSFTNYAYSYIKGRLLTEMTKSNKYQERSVYPKEEFWEVIEDPCVEVPFEVKLLLTYCDQLTENQTKWVLYTCVEDLTVKEIAEKENVSMSAVKAWRKGAKEKLRGNLEIRD